MPKLDWIDDSNLYREVENLINIAKNAKNQAGAKFGKNVIDPFSALFEISGFEIDITRWFESETTRQAQKTLQNHVGSFHQNILGYVEGWQNLKSGHVIDLVSADLQIIAEIKNKYNTLSFGKLSELYNSLDKLVSPKSSIYKGFTAYYVSIIPKYPVRVNKPFTPSDRDTGAKCPLNELIREIDGASFYTLATGCNNALEDLFDILPEVIQDCSKGKYIVRDTDKLKSFFSLAFG